jgi:hypothetical protein
MALLFLQEYIHTWPDETRGPRYHRLSAHHPSDFDVCMTKQSSDAIKPFAPERGTGDTPGWPKALSRPNGTGSGAFLEQLLVVVRQRTRYQVDKLVVDEVSASADTQDKPNNSLAVSFARLSI